MQNTPLYSYQQAVQETLERIIDKVELPLGEKVEVLVAIFAPGFALHIQKAALADADPALTETVRNAHTPAQLDLLFENVAFQARIYF